MTFEEFSAALGGYSYLELSKLDENELARRRLYDHLTSTGVDVGAVLRGKATLAPSALETLLRDLRYLAAPKVTGVGANLESEHELASAKRLPSVVRWAEQTLRVLSKEGKG